ncbi:hypothetical protein JCM24511_02293 [Saitozyma sp. JCM 24511]|nr:hypothetical protein JCM24511_02293 [Saitozyma sp. JCM 24511]
MSTSGPSRQTVNASYHPGGGASPSLRRARRPFKLGNAFVGGAVALFAAGVYAYSISSVKQDDFSDVADLLPPAAERAKIRTIEDEARDAALAKGQQLGSLSSLSTSSQGGGAATAPLSPVYQPSSPSALSKPLPSTSIGVIDEELGISGMDLPADLNLSWSEYLPKRMSEWGWFKRRGLVEDKGNVLVWGAPDVDKVGKVGDGLETKGPRRV